MPDPFTETFGAGGAYDDLDDPAGRYANDPNFVWNEESGRYEPVDPFLKGLLDLGGAAGFNIYGAPESIQGADVDASQSMDDRSRMGAILSQLQGQATTGGGAWEQALAANTQGANAAAASLGQTLSPQVGYASSLRAIGNAEAANNQRAVGQGNLLRAQTRQQATSMLGDALSGQMGLDAAQAEAQAGARQGATNLRGQLERQNTTAVLNAVGAGGQAVGALAGMSEGGEVPGVPRVFGDDEANDTVKAKLSPGEIVIPRSIALRPDAPEAAAAFVAAVKGRPSADTNFDDGGQVPVFGPEEVDTSRGVSLSLLPDPMAGAVKRGAQLDVGGYNETRGMALENQARQLQMAQGVGPSVAPQAFQNARDATIAQAMQGMSRGAPVDALISGAGAQAQGAAGNAAGIVAGEQQRGSEAFARAVLQQRNQDLALARAQQQAAFRDEMRRRGVSLEQQAALKNLMGGVAQGVTGAAGLFDDSSYGMTEHGGHTEGGASHAGYDTDTGSQPSHFADGGEIKPRRATRSTRERRRSEKLPPAVPDQGTPETDFLPFPRPGEQIPQPRRYFGTQTEDDQKLADGGEVFVTEDGAFRVDEPSLLEQIAGGIGSQFGFGPPPTRRVVPTEAPPRPAPQLDQHLSRETAPVQTFAPPPRPVAPTQPASPARAAVQRQPEVDPYAQQREGLRVGAEAEAAKGRETATALGELQKGLQENAIEAKEVQTRARQQAEADFGAIQQARDEMKSISTSVDPGRWWASRSTPGKIAGVIGLVLGAIGNDNGVNRAVGLINQFIDRDLDAQKSQTQLRLRQGEQNLASATQLYGLHRQMSQDDISANLAAKGTALDLAKSQVDIAAAKSMEPMAKSRLLELSGALDVAKKQSDDAAKQRGFDNSIKRMNAETDRMRAVNEGARAAAGANAKTFVAPGFELRPGATPKQEELGKWREAKGAADDIKNKTAQLKKMIEDGKLTRTDALAGENRATAEALVGDLKVSAKAAFELGALSESDLGLIMQQVADPTGFAALLKSDKSMTQKLDQFGKNVDARIKARGDVLGIVPSGETDLNAEAVAWLKANPNHPDAAAVKKKLGL